GCMRVPRMLKMNRGGATYIHTIRTVIGPTVDASENTEPLALFPCSFTTATYMPRPQPTIGRASKVANTNRGECIGIWELHSGKIATSRAKIARSIVWLATKGDCT